MHTGRLPVPLGEFDMAKPNVTSSRGTKQLLAAFPLSDTEIALVAPGPVHERMRDPGLYRTRAGLEVRAATLDPKQPDRILLKVGRMRASPLTTNEVLVKNLVLSGGRERGRHASPSFIEGIQTPVDLRAPHFLPEFPYPSTLVGKHVTVMCCTGCNGGTHHRDLVVLNHHAGGPFTGIWVRTAKTIDGPYPRWQRVMFAGGVIAEFQGATTVEDRGWMVVRKVHETPHHAPPPLPIETMDLPMKRSTALLTKGLDASWIQLSDVTVESTEAPAPARGRARVNLPRLEVILTDASGGRSVAWLYQKSAWELRPGQRLKALRGFVHAEQPGRYVLLGDKEEDIVR